MSAIDKVKPVSGVLRKLADIIDNGEAAQARIELNNIYPDQINAVRITDPLVSDDALRTFEFSLSITMSGASKNKLDG